MTFNHIIDKCVFQRSSCKTFNSVFTAAESDDLVALCKTVFNREFTNGRCVRLDFCEESEHCTRVGISEVGFYDFLLSNFTLFNYKKLLNSASLTQANLLLRLNERFSSDGVPDCIESILQRNYLANTVAVSLLIHDNLGRFLLTKRNNAVGISNGFVSVTVTGAIDDSDFNEKDPFRRCCQRELLEEMDYIIDQSTIQPFMIVCGEKKLQPIVLANAIVDDISDIISRIAQHKDFMLENSGYLICNKAELRDILLDSNTHITEAARTHLESVI